ncbi:SGNH/GDSL hydrolase family protein [Arthrobacter sp. ISL-28]|uniref:SGNH/GDSL hydrolase family protein n=1 Tax=Arthrobacter sp. ISL-28 TaxID=2819108 RepID=UPI001BEA1BF9|nr:SGNH/GDSL hydrolase family protein [Arthrobacter sp. ISL-28]MBT2523531.1 hypothetical protein [Arthrobacter sp. ISL-28]
MRIVAKLVAVPLLLLLAIGLHPPAEAYPRSIAALGDSISRAFAVCCQSDEQPHRSWSTGTSRSGGANSHLQRLHALRPGITGLNHAVSGARVDDLPRQAWAAVAQKAGYVTILIGANDLCASSASAMTSPEAFEADITSSLAVLQQGLPRSRVFLSSIPDIHHLWSVLQGTESARSAWASANTCPSMLNGSNTEAERQLVVQRLQVFNEILAQTCSRFDNCRWDGGAVYGYKYSASEVSTVDFFHPSLGGQAALAELTWNASYWAGE